MNVFPVSVVLQIGDHVSFQVLNVYLPGVNEVLETLTEQVELVGTVVELSDSGTQPKMFAVVEVDADQRVIVPADKVSLITTARPPRSSS
ncbi:MAG: hypothetical protein ABI165_11410 [Bryobacteraceae bacterium]